MPHLRCVRIQEPRPACTGHKSIVCVCVCVRVYIYTYIHIYIYIYIFVRFTFGDVSTRAFQPNLVPIVDWIC